MIPSFPMAASGQAAVAQSGWLRALFEAPGRPVWLVGAGLAFAGALVFGLQELVLGRFELAVRDPNVLDNMRVAVTHVVITAYLLTACVYAERITERAISDLTPLLDPRAARGFEPRGRSEQLVLALSVLVGAASFFAVSAGLSPGRVTFAPATWTPEEAWHRVLGLAMGILALRLATLLVLESRRLSSLAGAIRRIDLLDRAALAPFSRHGLSSALLIIGLVAAFALFLVDMRYLPMVGIVLVQTLVVGLVALLLPLRGIRSRILEAKRAELEWCRERMRRRRARLDEASGSDAPLPVASDSDDSRLDELVAWEARIEAVREWPLDASTFGRFVLYLLIPLGSWAGGALVERWIDALLD